MLSPTALHKRFLIGEIMDKADLEPRLHVHALNGLARINRFSGTSGMIWQSIRHLATTANGRLRILDLATGGGDLPIALWQRSQRQGLSLQIEGCDKSETALHHARQSAQRCGAEINFFQLDLIADDIPPDFDIVLCSLFLHHLENQSVVDLLTKIRERVNRMLVVSDLRRSYAGYLLACSATQLLSRSSIVHTDGARSVRAAFTVSEIQSIADQAGLSCACVRRKWPFRYLLVWTR